MRDEDRVRLLPRLAHEGGQPRAYQGALFDDTQERNDS